MVRARGRAEHHDQPSLGERPQLRQRAGQRTCRVREVDEHAEVLAQVDAFETAAHALEAREPPAHVVQRNAERDADTGRAHRVVDVEASRHGEGDVRLAERGLQTEVRAGVGHTELERMKVGGGREAVRPPARDRVT